jgi:caa(3)-type oxidase subunit IV
MSADAAHPYRGYWILWAVLLTVTLLMIAIEGAGLPAALAVVMLLFGSTIKATLIIFYYMHLKFEHLGLILTVLVGLFVTAILMFVVPAYDGSQILASRTLG